MVAIPDPVELSECTAVFKGVFPLGYGALPSTSSHASASGAGADASGVDGGGGGVGAGAAAETTAKMSALHNKVTGPGSFNRG